MESAKDNSFSSMPVISISMCLQSSSSCVVCSLKFFHIAALLVNAVNFPGITKPFSSLRGPVISMIITVIRVRLKKAVDKEL